MWLNTHALLAGVKTYMRPTTYSDLQALVSILLMYISIHEHCINRFSKENFVQGGISSLFSVIALALRQEFKNVFEYLYLAYLGYAKKKLFIKF